MSKINDLKRQYGKLKVEMERLEEEIEKLEEAKRKWNPKFGEKYYLVANNLDVDWYISNDSNYDKNHIKYNKVFKTEAEAQDYANYLKALKKASYEFTNEEWENKSIYKFYIYYNYENNELDTSIKFHSKTQNGIYFRRENEAQAFIGAHKEQILKYEFGIELFDTKI